MIYYAYHMRVSKFASRKEWSEYVWHELLHRLGNSKTSAILNSLLSSYEKHILVNRLAALALIKQGKTYQEISNELWLSSTTIRSLKKMLGDERPREYQSYRKRILPGKLKGKQNNIQLDSFIDILQWIEVYLSKIPKKVGPRWRFLRTVTR